MAKFFAKPSLVLVLLLSVMITGCLDSSEVKLVKEGRLGVCSKHTLEEMADGYLKNPEWTSGTSENGDVFVNLSGGVIDSSDGMESHVVFQFIVDEENQDFKYGAMEFDGSPKDEFSARILFSLMCANAKSSGSDSSDYRGDDQGSTTGFFGKIKNAFKRLFGFSGSDGADLPEYDQELEPGLMDRVRVIWGWISEFFSKNESSESSDEIAEGGGNQVVPGGDTIENESDAVEVNDSVTSSPDSGAGSVESRSPKFCSSGSNILFSCTTGKGKLIELCDAGSQIEYAFGYPDQEPEVLLKKERDMVTTEQWSGMGSMYYSIDVPNGNTIYRVYWSFSRDPESLPEAGVEVEIDSKRAAVVSCGEGEIYNNIEGVNLKPTPVN